MSKIQKLIVDCPECLLRQNIDDRCPDCHGLGYVARKDFNG